MYTQVRLVNSRISGECLCINPGAPSQILYLDDYPFIYLNAPSELAYLIGLSVYIPKCVQSTSLFNEIVRTYTQVSNQLLCLR